MDRLQLEPEAVLELRRGAPVAAREAQLAQLDEVVERVAAVGHRELRQADPPELELDVAALGDLEAAAHRVVVAREVEGHLGRGLEVELVRAEPPAVGVLERVARLDAEQRVVTRCVGGLEVVHVPRRDERQPELRGEPGQRLERRLLRLEADVLELDVGRVAAEDLREAV